MRIEISVPTSIDVERKRATKALTPLKFKRRATPRSRTGCITCRVRHVKCGEEKPQCRRCKATGWKCDGYSDAFVIGKNYGPTVDNGCYELSKISSETPLVVSWTSLPGNRREQQSFDYFRTKSVIHLSGFSGLEFWGRLVLQVMHEEPTLVCVILIPFSIWITKRNEWKWMKLLNYYYHDSCLLNAIQIYLFRMQRMLC